MNSLKRKQSYMKITCVWVVRSANLVWQIISGVTASLCCYSYYTAQPAHAFHALLRTSMFTRNASRSMNRGKSSAKRPQVTLYSRDKRSEITSHKVYTHTASRSHDRRHPHISFVSLLMRAFTAHWCSLQSGHTDHH